MGSAVAIPAILIPTLASPWAGAVLAALGTGAGVAAYRGSPRIMAWQSRRRQQRQDQPVHTAAQAEHDALLSRWSRYELDPACSVDYPAMTDVRLPETAARLANRLPEATPYIDRGFEAVETFVRSQHDFATKIAGALKPSADVHSA